ncbi:TetR/AcrR family transcriptional regulator [Streptomyces sp. NPDC026672]|uniref:TetR/AcrR family transcriptional regulator n=1 Tax=unclassified Streptomyces TaxID=2593676 RepID=UPI0033C38598
MLTKKGAATRRRIIEAAVAEIRDRGVGDLTLDGVCRRSGTGKSQLFHYFPEGKEQLLLAVAQREADLVIEEQQSCVGELTSWSAWREWRDEVVQRYRRHGVSCPLGAMITETDRPTPAAQEVTRRMIDQWQHHIEAGIKEMQALGHIRSDVDAGTAAAGVIAAIHGGVVIFMATGSPRHIEAAFDMCVDHLRTGTALAA